MKLKKATAEIKEKLNLLAKINGKKNRKKERGFTLIELIAVVIILGVLLALVVPKIIGSSDDANVELITKTVKDIRDAVAMGKMKCLSDINNNGCSSAGESGGDAGKLLPTLWGNSCQVLAPYSFNINNNAITVKSFTIQTDCQNGASAIQFTIGCAGSNDLCTKVQNQLNNMYGNVCPNAPSNGQLTCTMSL